MKQIIVYYSLNGNTDYMAKRMAKETGADLLRLKPVKPFPADGAMKFLKGGMSVMFGMHPELEPYTFDADQYDCIILGTPVWAGRIASPLATFLKKESLANKKLGLFMCHGDEKDVKCMERFKKKAGKGNIIQTALFVEPLSKKDQVDAKALKEFLTALR